MTPPGPTILETMENPALFGPWFTPVAPWRSWRAFLAALFGLPLSEPLRVLYQAHTGRTTPPTGPAREAWMVVGRRGGKSRIAALVAVYLATFRDYRAILAPGEKGTVMLLAADRRQARVLMRYVTGLLDGVPMLAQPHRRPHRRVGDALHRHRPRDSHELLPGGPRLHGDRRDPGRGGLLAHGRGVGQPGRRGVERAAPGHGHGAGGADPGPLQPLQPARAPLGEASGALRPGRRPHPGLAGRHPQHEPHGAGVHHRARLRGGSGGGRRRVRRPVPDRRRGVPAPRGRRAVRDRGADASCPRCQAFGTSPSWIRPGGRRTR